MTGTEYKLKTLFSGQGPPWSGLWLSIQLYCLWIFLCSSNMDSQNLGRGSSRFYALEDPVLQCGWNTLFLRISYFRLFWCHLICYLPLLWCLLISQDKLSEVPFFINVMVTRANIALSICLPPSILLATITSLSSIISQTIITRYVLTLS